MSLAIKAAAGLLGLPPELADQLPELVAQIPALVAQLPEFVSKAVQAVSDAEARLATINETLARVERKLDVLGNAVIDLMEQTENVHVADAATAARNGNNSNLAAVGNGTDA